MAKELRVSKGSTWRKRHQAGVIMEFPSGMVARILSVGPDLILKTGRIPDTLTSHVVEMLEGKAEKPISKETMQSLIEQVEFMYLVCETMLADPHVVEHPEADDEIGIEDLEYTDKQMLLALVGANTLQLERFRDQQARHVDDLVSSEGHGASGERDSEPAAVGGDDNRI